MVPPQRGDSSSSGVPPPRERRESLAAWRFDTGEEAYALLVLPLSFDAEEICGRLTPAEREVARLVVGGLSNAEIARRRGGSPRTVANQAASIFRKLGVRSRLGLYALIARGISHHADGHA